MSALDLIVAYLMAGYEDVTEGYKKAIAPQVRGEAQALHNAVAHELAEKQRDMLRQGFRMEPWASVVNSLGEDEPMGTTHVIDHIDPEVTEVRPARVALTELRDPEKEASDGS